MSSTSEKGYTKDRAGRGCEVARGGGDGGRAARAIDGSPTRVAANGETSIEPSDRLRLATQRVQAPDPVSGYMSRPGLERRCEGLDRRLTMIVAPGGFGKTVLLAHCCRRLRSRGVLAAWLEIEPDDNASTLATYLALSFEQAGLATFTPTADPDTASEAADGGESEADSHAGYRIDLLIRALERHAALCLLALDEVEQLGQPGALSVVNALLRRGPRNLHVVMALRARPPGLDVAMPLLEGSGSVLTAEDLRFSRGEIARFVAAPLSRRELNAVAERTAGWPMALRIYRNKRRDGAPADVEGDTVAAWVETRLWRGLARTDRDLLLDIALFDWFDADLMDEATGVRDSAQRIASARALTGLLQTVASGAGRRRLHPLLKAHCAERRAREDPERARTIHRGIAQALAHRGYVVEAVRHAMAAGDARLAGELAESAGGVRLAAYRAFESLAAVVRLLTPAVLDMYPRLALAQCLVHAQLGEMGRAEAVYRAVANATSEFTRDRDGGDHRALAIDRLVLVGKLGFTGCRLTDSNETPLLAEAEKLAADTQLEPGLRATLSYGLSTAYASVGVFATAADWIQRAREQVGSRLGLAAHVGYQAGTMAMAQGHADDAARHYGEALDAARRDHLHNPGTVLMGEILREELAFEQRGPLGRFRDGRVSLRLLGESGASFVVYAAYLGVRVEIELWKGRPEDAQALSEEAREYAMSTKRNGLAQFASALGVGVLLARGRAEEAAKAWLFHDLPAAADCLAERRGWRLTELLACTRMRLSASLGEVAEARELARGLRSFASRIESRRTLMRVDAQSMALEYRVGNPAGASAHLAACLRLYADTGYGGALVREREAALATLESLAEAPALSGALQNLSSLLRRAMTGEAEHMASTFTDAELQVLFRLARQRQDKQIATELGLSVDGVRYRLRRIFAKLGVRSRHQAVDRARGLGILPEAPATDPRNPGEPASRHCA